MAQPERYNFREVTLRDIGLLMAWQSQPHVSKWWGSDEPYDAKELGDPRVARWIVELDSKPFAFMQDYAVHGWEEHHFSYLPQGTRGIDQYIGEPRMLGCGHGSAFIGQRMQQLFASGVPVIATDPHPENDRAIAVYRKLGFQVAGSPIETKWGLILPMEARN